MRVDVLVWIKDQIRGRYLGRHMDHLADSIAKLSQGRENWYEGHPISSDNDPIKQNLFLLDTFQ